MADPVMPAAGEAALAQWINVGLAACTFGVLVHINLDSVCGAVLTFLGLVVLALSVVGAAAPQLGADARLAVALGRLGLVCGVCGVGVWAAVGMARHAHAGGL